MIAPPDLTRNVTDKRSPAKSGHRKQNFRRSRTHFTPKPPSTSLPAFQFLVEVLQFHFWQDVRKRCLPDPSQLALCE